MNNNIVDEIYDKLRKKKDSNDKKIKLINDLLSYSDWYKELDNDIIFDILITLEFEKSRALDILKEITKLKIY